MSSNKCPVGGNIDTSGLLNSHFHPFPPSRTFIPKCLVFAKFVLCISSNLEIGILSGLFLLCVPHRRVYANHLDILYSFGVRGRLYSALMGTLVSNEKSDEIRCFEYRTCANFCSLINPSKLVSFRRRSWLVLIQTTPDSEWEKWHFPVGQGDNESWSGLRS